MGGSRFSGRWGIGLYVIIARWGWGWGCFAGHLVGWEGVGSFAIGFYFAHWGEFTVVFIRRCSGRFRGLEGCADG